MRLRECMCSDLVWCRESEWSCRAAPPRIDDPEFGILAPAEATKVYRRVLDEIAKYLDEMEHRDR
jgi:hypothetical protein